MPLTEQQSDAIIAAVRRVAADEILPRFRNLGRNDVDAKSTFDDLVTVADTAAEVALTAEIERILPGDTVIGEEAVSADRSLLAKVGEGRVTIIDPIDGTWNFAHGVANYGVILAVVEDGKIVWGLLYDPSFDDWVMAAVDQGAWFHRNGTARQLRTEQDVQDHGHLRGNVGAYMFPEAERFALSATTGQFRRATSYGPSLHEYRQLVLSASDFCLNGMLNVWDHAAGVLILSEAGGHSALLDGSPYSPMMTEGRLLNARSEALWHSLADTFNGALRAASGQQGLS